MPFFLSRLLARLLVLRSWATPIVVIVFVFVTSWPLMALAEPDGSALVRPENFWWYFVVTAATVGYGDYYPETGAGHVVGAYVIVGGIVTLTTVFTKMASILEQARGRRMQGAITVDASGHVVLIGYTAGRTERIVHELLADGTSTVVLCAWDDVATHPMPEEPVEFVRGELNDPETLRRAGVHRARTVLVDARDDNEALAIAVIVDHVVESAHIVVTLRDMAQTSLIHYVDAGIRCVQWHTPRMITEELTSPGIAEVYAELMTHGGANTYSVPLPESLGPVLVDHCRTALGRGHGATLLAARTDSELIVNPNWRTELPAGSTLYYVSERRLTTEQITAALRQPVS
ncbi:voltage-gated potassium channel [Prauserella shujinwangii]|uniref:Voltage-gated potassium channel n=1 Tax=Prauserella shujinwangii TaxID=1453103 RepID=A0A2T0M0W3_9PSEU|nr:ion channel [Prauserella shujinwangii]PRX50243.1 voltage-gated potassium channel [Prauserella shujinwangii]